MDAAQAQVQLKDLLEEFRAIETTLTSEQKSEFLKRLTAIMHELNESIEATLKN